MIDAENHLMKHKGVDRDDDVPTCPECGTALVLRKITIGERGLEFPPGEYTCLRCKTDFSYPVKIDPMAEDDDIPF